MKIILIGIQGSGKSTQGNILSERLSVPYLSTGHVLREMAKEKTREGRYIKETINSGILVPDDIMMDLASDYLKRPEYLPGYLLDGFPRTVAQAETFMEDINKVIYLRVSDKEALWRLSYRENEEGRDDDTLIAIRKRIELFHEFTVPVLDFYDKKNLLLEVDGEKTIEEITDYILDNLR